MYLSWVGVCERERECVCVCNEMNIRMGFVLWALMRWGIIYNLLLFKKNLLFPSICTDFCLFLPPTLFFLFFKYTHLPQIPCYALERACSEFVCIHSDSPYFCFLASYLKSVQNWGEKNMVSLFACCLRLFHVSPKQICVTFTNVFF